MIKAFICSIVITFLAIHVQAQLLNTEWIGKINVPMPTDCVLKFKADTLFIIYAGADPIPFMDKDGKKTYPTGKDSIVIETSYYFTKGDSLTIKKISGGSPCDDNAVGKYIFTIQKQTLTFKTISDDCKMRPSSWEDIPLTKL